MIRRVPFALALVVATFAGPAWCAEPRAVVEPPDVVAPGDIVLIDGAASTGDAFDWESLSGKRLIPSESGKRAYFASGTPGKFDFLFVAVGVVDGKAGLSKARVTVTVSGPVPPTPIPPGPGPGPTPPPTPVPVPAGPLHVSLVCDLDSLSPDTTAVRIGLGIREQEGPLAFRYRTYPVTSPSLDALNLRKYVATVGTPALIVQDQAGRVVSVEKAPTEEAAVIARVKQFRGAN